METLPGGFSLELPDSAFPLSTDSVLLAHFAKLPRNSHVLDLGSGCGTLGILLCSKDSTCHVTGLELHEFAHQAAEENIRRNHLEDRMESICCDLRTASLTPGSFSCCISNPPYFQGGPASQTHPDARREDQCTPEALFAAGAGALKFGGDFFLVHRPERLAQLIAVAGKYRLEAKRLALVRHRQDGPISLILLKLRKGAAPGLQITEHCLYDSQNVPTAFYREVYHI